MIEDGILEVEYGEYPQKAVSKEIEISVIEEKSEKELVLEKDKQKILSLKRNLVNKR